MVQALQGPSVEERVAQLQELLDSASPQVRQEYQERFDIAWIYHDSALEGVVYSMDELRAAIYGEIVADPSLIPVYDEIRNHMGAIEMIREMSSRRRFTPNLEVIKKLFAQLAPEELEGKGPPKYRKDMPLHRPYSHETSQPDKTRPRMRQLVHGLADPDANETIHPVRAASTVHQPRAHTYPVPLPRGTVPCLALRLILMDGLFAPRPRPEHFCPPFLHDAAALVFNLAQCPEGP